MAVIDKNVVNYEQIDECDRFDDIKINFKTDEFLNREFKILFKSESEIQLYNVYNTGYGGEKILININCLLEIVKVSYSEWSDDIDLDNPIEYKASKINLKLNQSPFENLNGLRGEYLLEVLHIDKNGNVVETKPYKAKFKTYKEIPENSPEYQWAVKQSLIFHDITDREGNYLNPDRPAQLKSNKKELVNEIKKLSKDSKDLPVLIKTLVVVNEFGKIEKISEFNNPLMDYKLKGKTAKLIKKMTEWYPACINDVEVKTEIPFLIIME